MRRMIIAGVAVVVVLAGLFVVDGQSRQSAATAAAVRIHDSLGSPDMPSVSIGGWPFLPTLVTKKVAGLDATLTKALLPIEGGGVLTLDDVTFKGTDVTLGSGRPVVAALATLSGTASYSNMSLFVKKNIYKDSSGMVGIDTGATVNGHMVDVKVTGHPMVDPSSSAILLAEAKVMANGVDVTAKVDPQERAQLWPMMRLTLADGLRVRDLAIGERGITLDFSGTNVLMG